jgi:hypothetical protein
LGRYGKDLGTQVGGTNRIKIREHYSESRKRKRVGKGREQEKGERRKRKRGGKGKRVGKGREYGFLPLSLSTLDGRPPL